MRVLTLKSSPGNDIRQVQYFLLGLKLYVGIVDGEYGPMTETAVRSYQIIQNITADGWVGPQTYGRMINDGLPVIVDTNRDIPQRPADMKILTANEEKMRRWGRLTYISAPTKSNPEGITITNDFEDKFIGYVECPIWGSKRVRLHIKVAIDYVAFMKELVAKKLSDRIITFDGGFYPRFQRGSRSLLSNHSWGTAFDINAETNPMGKMPPFIGEPGCLREIVEIGVKYGWYWGRWFKRPDGMHFEHV